MNYQKLLASHRVGLLDEVRGLCLILMVLYHGAYDLIYMFGIGIPAFHWPILTFAQPFVAGIFILISGACCRYSHNNLRRGLMALGFGLVMTLVTRYIMPGQTILFGILHFMGCAMILFRLLKTTLDRIPAFWGMCLMGLALALAWYVPGGTAVAGHFELPQYLYQSRYLFPLGFPGPGFASADYFPLLPWIFCFFAGSYLGQFFVQKDMPSPLYRVHMPFFAAVGRHSLMIYVLHQPIIYGVLRAFFWLSRDVAGLI